MKAQLQNKTYTSHNPKETKLYQIVKTYYPLYEEQIQQRTGSPLPKYVKQEFENYLKCGLYEYGFLRLKCTDDTCEHEQILAFSCKGRGFCPSCGGKRMAETAQHLVDHLLPHAAYRQFVLSMPIALRFWARYNPKLLAYVHKVFTKEIQNLYSQKLDSKSYTGGVSFVQRFGSAMQFNLHLHTLVIDGAFVEKQNGDFSFHQIKIHDEDIESLITRVSEKIIRKLKSLGYLNEEGEHSGEKIQTNLEEEAHLTDITSASMQNVALFSEIPNTFNTKIGCGFGFTKETPLLKSELLASKNGFTIHGKTKTNTLDREGLNRLIEYQARPPISDERIFVEEDGMVWITLKKPYADGTTHIKMTPLDFIAKLHALIPPRFLNQTLYFGVLAPAHSKRSKLILSDISKKAKPHLPDDPQSKGDDPHKLARDSQWAKLLKRTFAIDVSLCPKCEADLKILAAVQDPDQIERYLTHTNQKQTSPPHRIPKYLHKNLEGFTEDPDLDPYGG